MTYTSLQSPQDKTYSYQIRIAHLYGNLLNTYGDNGNVLMLKYVAEKLNAMVTVDIVSIGDDFKEDDYDIIFFGGGKIMNNPLWLRTCQVKKKPLQTTSTKTRLF